MHWWYGTGPDGTWWPWMMPFGGLLWLVVLALVIAAIFWFARSQPSARAREVESDREARALQILDERFARGEIDREEYLQKRRDLLR